MTCAGGASLAFWLKAIPFRKKSCAKARASGLWEEDSFAPTVRSTLSQFEAISVVLIASALALAACGGGGSRTFESNPPNEMPDSGTGGAMEGAAGQGALDVS